MKIALLADIHGNYHALEAVLEDIQTQQPDKLFVLGDLVFKGPLPGKCIQAVQRSGAEVIQGNIDELVGLGFIQEGFAKSPEHEAALSKEMAWNRARLSEDDLEYLARLPFELEEELPGIGLLRCVHATPQNLLDIVLPTADDSGYERMFECVEPAIVAYAHIHQPYIRYIHGKAVFNTGSVGLPFDGDPRASYAILETDDSSDFGISIRRIRYDVEAAVSALLQDGHPFADSVIAAIRSGRRPL